MSALLELEGLRFRYGGGVTALDGLDLAVAPEAGGTSRIDGLTDLRKTIEDLVDKHNVPRTRVRGLT